MILGNSQVKLMIYQVILVQTRCVLAKSNVTIATKSVISLVIVQKLLLVQLVMESPIGPFFLSLSRKLISILCYSTQDVMYRWKSLVIMNCSVLMELFIQLERYS